MRPWGVARREGHSPVGSRAPAEMAPQGGGPQVVVVLSGSMEPGFYRGDILFLHMGRAPIRAGEAHPRVASPARPHASLLARLTVAPSQRG